MPDMTSSSAAGEPMETQAMVEPEPVASDTNLLEDIFGSAGTSQTTAEPDGTMETSGTMDNSLNSTSSVGDTAMAGTSEEQMQVSQEPTSSNGFYDENGMWQDMSGYVPDATTKAIVDEAIADSTAVSKVGDSAADASNDFYSEEDAKKLSTFDIQGWL